MKKQVLIFYVTAAVLLSLVCTSYTNAEEKQGRKWNNPEAKKRYEKYSKEAIKARGEESKAWQDYDRKLEKAENDVRRVRDEAYKGAFKGGAAGAATGAAKGAAKGIYERGKDYYKNQKTNK